MGNSMSDNPESTLLANDMLMEQNMKLESSKKIALEAESTAIETMTNLRG